MTNKTYLSSLARTLVLTAAAALLVFSISGTSRAQILVENFDYPAGSLITANNWAAHSAAGTSPITVTASGLIYSGYPGSSVGNAAALPASGEDDNRTFTAQTANSVYAAFLVNLNAATTAGDYFFHFTDSAIGTATFKGRVFARRDANNNVSFGISKSSTIVYTPSVYALGTTYLLVVKYTFVTGTANDTVDLFVNPATTGAEPAPTVTATDTAQADNANIGAVALRQGGTSAPNVIVDGIRVGTSYSDAVSFAPTAATVSVSGRVLFDNRNNPKGRLGTDQGTVTVTGTDGISRSVETGRGGVFFFDDLEAGETYVITVEARNYNFAPLVITPTANISEMIVEPGK